METELDKLLGDSGSDAANQTGDTKPEDEKKKSAEEGLRNALVAERKKREEMQTAYEERLSRLEKTTEVLRPEVKPVVQEDLSTQDAWKAHISSKSSEAVKPVLDEIGKAKQANWEVASANFAKKHPEYANTPEGKERLAKVVDFAKNKLGVNNEFSLDEISDKMETSYVVENRDVLIGKARDADRYKEDSEYSINQIASSSGSGGAIRHTSNIEDSATPEERRAYQAYRARNMGERDFESFVKILRENDL